MESWWTSLMLLDKVVWALAIITSVVFLVQTVLTFIGMDSGTDFDADFDGDFEGIDSPFQLFTFRNLINFLLGFSWSVIAFRNLIGSEILLLIVATLIGAALVAAMMYMMFLLSKLQQDGSMKMENAIGQSATVYLTIPRGKTGVGKIHVKIQNTIREVDAITDGDEIETGALVKVIGVYESAILIVNKI